MSEGDLFFLLQSSGTQHVGEQAELSPMQGKLLVLFDADDKQSALHIPHTSCYLHNYSHIYGPGRYQKLIEYCLEHSNGITIKYCWVDLGNFNHFISFTLFFKPLLF